MNTFLRRYGDIVLAGLLALFFFAWPEVDLALAERFYRPGEGFPAAQIWWIKIVYVLVAKSWIVAPVLLLLLLAGSTPVFPSHWAQRRKAILFLLLALIAGPGFIVNTVMKGHVGRPRPVHLIQFGGTSTFTPPIPSTRQCPKNCAFPSGHAAAAFYLMAGYWPARRKRWLLAGIAFGLFVGVIRMAMGAHFLSDILFAGFVVHFACRVLARLFGFAAAPVSQDGMPDLEQTHQEAA